MCSHSPRQQDSSADGKFLGLITSSGGPLIFYLHMTQKLGFEFPACHFHGITVEASVSTLSEVCVCVGGGVGAGVCGVGGDRGSNNNNTNIILRVWNSLFLVLSRGKD